MGVIFWAIVVCAVLVTALTATKLWALAGRLVAVKPSKYTSAAWNTAEGEIDDFVREAERLWPVLRPMPIFWIACATLAGMVALNVHFGLETGGYRWAITTVVLVLLFSAADLALAALAVNGDRGDGDWWEFKAGDRSYVEWVLIVVFTLMSMAVVVLSTADVQRGTEAQASVTQSKWSEMRAQLADKTAERKRLVDMRTANGGLSRQALEVRAKETAEAADREALRKKCATKCEALKAEAVKWEAQAADARREDALTEEIAALQAKLTEADDIKEGSDPIHDFAGTFGGDGDIVKKWLFIIFGVAFAIGNTLLWLRVGDKAGEARAAEFQRRGTIGDAKRAVAGLPPKYTGPSLALGLPKPDEKTGDTIVINVAAEDMRRRYANDADLLEVDALFGSLIVQEEGAAVTIAELYRLYQVDKLRHDPNSRYMTQPTMASKISLISQHRDDVVWTGDGRILGWTVKKATAVAAE